MVLRVTSGLVLAAVAVLSGCAQPPRGEYNGRVEVNDTTAAEKASPEVQLTAQHEFSDRVAQQLAADLSKIPALTEHGYRNTVVFGDIVNKTGIVPTSEFEAFRMRIRGKLMQSQNVLKNIRFVESRARLDALRAREGNGGSGDILQEGGTKSGAQFNPKYTFFLNGEMYRANRANVNEYLMAYTLTSMDSGEIVWQNEPYEVKQVH